MNSTVREPIHSDKVNELPSSLSGKKCVLATKHGKENALQGLFRTGLDLQIVTPKNIDTDSLGTFTGEVPRKQRTIETAIRKAKLGMKLTGIKTGMATEGTFSPDPIAPFIKLHSETIVFIDESLGIKIHETAHSYDTPFDSFTCAGFEEIREKMDKTGFPSHAMTVRPEKTGWISKIHGNAKIYKGIRNYDQLEKAIKNCCKASSTKKAVVETDVRAHMNPTRMHFIRELGSRLLVRLKSKCPDCGVPGWGVVLKKAGLPCGICGLPTDMILHEVKICSACNHTEESGRSDNLKFADPTYCANCNP